MIEHIDSFVVLIRQEGDIAEVFHESTGLPAEQKLDLIRGKTIGMQNDTCPHTEGVRREPELIFRFVLVDVEGKCPHNFSNLVLGDETNNTIFIFVDSKRHVLLVNAHQAIKASKDRMETADETAPRVPSIPNKEAFFTMVAVLLVTPSKPNT